jgi:hypothetical protein
MLGAALGPAQPAGAAVSCTLSGGQVDDTQYRVVSRDETYSYRGYDPGDGEAFMAGRGYSDGVD